MIYNNPYVPFEIILRNQGEQGKNGNFLGKHSQNRVKLTLQFLKISSNIHEQGQK